MVAIRAMQSRVARLSRRRESYVAKVCGSWEAFSDAMLAAVSSGEIEPEDAEDIYFGVKRWHDDPGMWTSFRS